MIVPHPESRAYVEAIIRYTDPSSAGGQLKVDDHASSSFELHEHVLRIHNARRDADEISFEQCGFTMVRHKTAANLLDKRAVERTYYKEAEAIVKQLTGASEVIVFLDLVRSEARGPEAQGVEPAANAHVDFDERSVRLWVETLRPDDADRLLAKRFVNINLWRPIRPVERKPLALCDARSIVAEDLIPIVIDGRPDDPAGPFSGFNLVYNPQHRWHYYPQLQVDEVLAFKIFDSDGTRPYLAAHTAFDDPTSRADAPKRLSIEVRTIAFID